MSEVTMDVAQINKAVWSAGKWDAVSERIAQAGPKLLDRLDIKPGDRLLDVGAGSGGTVSIPAALRGAKVVASDLVSDHFADGRRRARAAGVEIEWVEANAEDLPFEDGSFDFVTSTFGHMFAPHHRLAAAELARVCSSGGTVATGTWADNGFVGAMFRTMGLHMPPPPEGSEPPILWGSEQYVREMLEPHGLELTFDRDAVVFADASAEDYMDFHEENFGPMVMAKARLGDDWPQLREALLELDEEWNESSDGQWAVSAQFLITIGRK